MDKSKHFEIVHNSALQQLKNELIFKRACLTYDLEIEISNGFNFFKMLPLQEELCLTNYYLKCIHDNNLRLIPREMRNVNGTIIQ